MEAAFKEIATMKPRPYIGDICRVSNTLAKNIFPQRPKLCLKAQLWGCCMPNCAHEHLLITDEEADRAINFLGIALKNPEKLKQVK